MHKFIIGMRATLCLNAPRQVDRGQLRGNRKPPPQDVPPPHIQHTTPFCRDFSLCVAAAGNHVIVIDHVVFLLFSFYLL